MYAIGLGLMRVMQILGWLVMGALLAEYYEIEMSSILATIAT